MFKQTSDGLLIKVKIIPNSSRNAIIVEDGTVKVKVTAQPIENKANKALIEFLSKKINVPKSKIEILKGLTAKEKTILVKVEDMNKQSIIEQNLKEGT